MLFFFFFFLGKNIFGDNVVLSFSSAIFIAIFRIEKRDLEVLISELRTRVESAESLISQQANQLALCSQELAQRVREAAANREELAFENQRHDRERKELLEACDDKVKKLEIDWALSVHSKDAANQKLHDENGRTSFAFLSLFTVSTTSR